MVPSSPHKEAILAMVGQYLSRVPAGTRISWWSADPEGMNCAPRSRQWAGGEHGANNKTRGGYDELHEEGEPTGKPRLRQPGPTQRKEGAQHTGSGGSGPRARRPDRGGPPETGSQNPSRGPRSTRRSPSGSSAASSAPWSGRPGGLDPSRPCRRPPWRCAPGRVAFGPAFGCLSPHCPQPA